jgi:hypothetical protein
MAAWRADVDQVGIEQAIMIARDNSTRATLNREARAWRERRGALGERITIGNFDIAVGDRVIARRNARDYDVDNGTRGTVRAVDRTRLAVTIQTDDGQSRELPADYVVDHLEHAYALTGHGSQGATVERAQVIGTAGDFTNEWAYTALSRARDPVTAHLLARSTDRSDRAEFAPTDRARAPRAAIEAMRAAMRRCEREDLALDQASIHQRAPVAGEAAAERAEAAQREQLALDLDTSPSVASGCPRHLRPCAGSSRCGASSERSDPTRSTAPPSNARGTPSPTFRAHGSPNARTGSMRCFRPSRTTKSRPPAASSASPPCATS